jgi:hypothetical protein
VHLVAWRIFALPPLSRAREGARKDHHRVRWQPGRAAEEIFVASPHLLRERCRPLLKVRLGGRRSGSANEGTELVRVVLALGELIAELFAFGGTLEQFPFALASWGQRHAYPDSRCQYGARLVMDSVVPNIE